MPECKIYLKDSIFNNLTKISTQSKLKEHIIKINYYNFECDL